MIALRPTGRSSGREGYRRCRRPFAACTAAATALVLLSVLSGGLGCRPAADAPPTSAAPDSGRSGLWQDELFVSAVDSLHRLEQFHSDQTLGEILRRIAPPGSPASSPKPPPNALLATWPEPPMLTQIVERLNQWLGPQPADPDWRPDPLLDTLPAPLRRLPMLDNLGAMELSPYDGFALREAVWLRDVSAWAAGEKLDELSRAEHLFDWVVRNVQLPPGESIPQTPWETLWFGQGTEWDRAWVFILLLRQQGIDAAVLAVGDGGADGAAAESSAEQDGAGEGNDPGAPLRPWAVGVLCEGDIYLFDPALGLPIPNSDGPRLDPRGRLVVRPATLSQAAAEPRVLERLDLDAERRYPVRRDDLRHVVALVEASPACLALRMRRIESRLAGPQKIVLSSSPSAVARRMTEAPGIAEARLWTLPFETLDRRLRLDHPGVQRRLLELLPYHSPPTGPSLWKGRMLYLKGSLGGPEGATGHLQAARPSNEDLAGLETQLIDEFFDNVLPADGSVSEEELAAARQRLLPSARQAAQVQTTFLYRTKQDATYWLGLIAFEQGNYRAAFDYLATRTLEVAPDGPWVEGARYNLARSFEAAGHTERAALLLQSDSLSPDQYGNTLRGRWLLGEHLESEPAAEVPSAPPAEEPAEEEPMEEPEEPQAPEVPEEPQAPEVPEGPVGPTVPKEP